MNVHHLELFYYVARHGGISEAVRKMPYGIQQPAVSGQILQLEDTLGVTLFQRRPFVLTPAGQELFEFAEPFFSRLEEVAEKVSGGKTQLVRMAASSIVLKDHLPELFRDLKVRFPKLKLVLQSGLQTDVAGALERQDIDLGVTAVDGKPPAGISQEELMQLPLVLLVEKQSGIRSAEDLFGRDRISEALIGLPAKEPVSKQFQAGLAKRRIHWPVSIEVNSLDLIETYVAGGFGVGVTVDIPGRKWSPGVRVISLPDFPPLVLTVLWRGKLSPLHKIVVEECVSRARVLGENLMRGSKAAAPKRGSKKGASL